MLKTFIFLSLIAALVISQTCSENQFYNPTSLACEACYSTCDSWCKGPLESDCISCIPSTGVQTQTLYQDFSSWTCVTACPAGTIAMETQHIGLKFNPFRYCRSNEYYVDPSSTASNIELGTRLYPFKMMDDPFREIFRHAAQLNSNFTIYLKHGSNHTMHSLQMPLVAVNSYIILTSYSDDPAFDGSESLTTVSIYHQSYWRPSSNFNPTIHSATALSDPYDYDTRITQGILSSGAKSSSKIKFVTYNANLVVKYLNFTEITFVDSSTNALFFPFYGAYRWLNITKCAFYLKQHLFFANEGANVKLEYSHIDITSISRLTVQVASSSCSVFDNQGIANNQILLGNTFTGLNEGGYTTLLWTQNHMNVTMRDNVFRDIQWIPGGLSISVEQFNLKCSKEPYVKIEIVNNTVINTDQVRMSHVFFTVKLTEDGVQDIIVNNNKYINVSYVNPGFFKMEKLASKNVYLEFQNNYFENVVDDSDPFALASFTIQKQLITNNTIKNSIVPTFISVVASEAVITDIIVSNVNGLSSSSIDNAMVQIKDSSNIIGSNYIFEGLSPINSRLISCSSSTNVTINDVSIKDIQVSNNHLIYFSQTLDVVFNNYKAYNINKTSPSSLYLIGIVFLQPHSTPGKEMTYQFTNWSMDISQLSFFGLQSLLVSSTDTNKMSIDFNDLSITNTTLSGKQSMIAISSFKYQNFKFTINNVAIQQCTINQGVFFEFKHNSKGNQIDMLTFENNQGQMMLLKP